MSLLRENQIKRRKILSKYNFIHQQIEVTNDILGKASLEIDEKVGLFLKEDNNNFHVAYNEIDQELEAFLNKLCFIQDALEDGKLNIENDVACCLDGMNTEKSTNNKSEDTNHLKQRRSSSCSAESNVPVTLSNEPCLSNLASNISCIQQNNINVNSVNDVKESNSERNKLCQNVKNISQMEHVSSSDGSSVYGTVSSACSEVQIVDKSESSVSNNLLKNIHNGKEESLKRVLPDPFLDRFPDISKENTVRSEVNWPNSEDPAANKWPNVASTDSGWCSVLHAINSRQTCTKSTSGVHSTEPSVGMNIPYLDLKIGSHVVASLQDINSPTDFWIQIDSTYAKELCPVTSPAEYFDELLAVKKDMYCLAPKQNGEYFRAKIINITEKVPGKQRAKIIYVDLGFKASLSVNKLKALPSALQKIPSLAVHCALHGVVPIDGKWSYKATEQFKHTFEVSDTKILVVSRVCNTYVVQVTMTACIPGNKTFTYDMADMLCQYNFAVKVNKVANLELPFETCSSVTSCSSGSTPKVSVSESPSTYFSSASNSEYSWTRKSEIPLSSDSHDFNTANYNSQQKMHWNKEVHRKPLVDSSEMNRTAFASKDGDRNTVAARFALQSAEVDTKSTLNNKNHTEKNQCVNVTESNSLVNNTLPPIENKNVVKCSDVPVADMGTVSHTKVPICNLPSASADFCKKQKALPDQLDEFDWHVNISFTNQKFEKKDKFIVMLSTIVNPSDFYVNLAMPTSTHLDDLQERMISVYQNLDMSGIILPPTDELQGKFCCCQFAEDKNWYRVQVLELCDSVENAQNSATLARIQYVDYGNIAVVNINDLIPLKKEFAVYPAFSYHCSLAGIKPKLSGNSLEEDKWNEEAISRFKCLTSFDRCYTAEIANTVTYDCKRAAVPVYLWDTVSTTDILINAVLVEQGAADGSGLQLINSPLEDMDKWNPMAVDYHSRLNSYGVDMSDPQVATVGYKAKDESYVCKFFSSTGKCDRGDRCYYKHIFSFGNSTIDKEVIGSLGENISLPAVGSAVLVQISAMINPGHFFIVFPFGTITVELIQSEMRRSIYKEEDVISKFLDDMNSYYNRNTHRKENTALSPACGDLVAVKWKKDGRWHRCRVCDAVDVTSPLLVYLLDFGNCEVVELEDVRELEQQFRHFPFQAVECRLHGIEPKSTGGQQQIWSEESKIKFQEITERKVLVALIKNIYGSSLYVELFSCSKDQQEVSINEYLVCNGYGQHEQQVNCNNSVSSQNSQEKNVVFIPA